MDQNVSHGVEPVNNMKPPTTPGALLVECARCFKWRYIPTKERYFKPSSTSEKTTLRSSIEVEKYVLIIKFLPRYLEQHPEDATQSAKLDNFSFQIPRSLEEDYVVNGGMNLY
ncbi:hypothetical protein KY290_001616 [Solanum tuberosum]|uniref:CW-type domain-containing protein n=1 Tax=Solanum tuberosum TaxID=4113 RepID=A0ABQ7WMR0_SOLTU|nr:hypothetical protein KY284_001651 [Solanum tuberosum]KAH0782018.1 hypothetical protein KY290_001616 [Solanum tuberosum]